MAGYRLGAGAKLPPLLLDDDEAIAVAIGLGIAATGTVAGIEEAPYARSPSSSRSSRRGCATGSTLLHSVTVTVPAAGPTVEPEVLTAVAVACRDHQRFRFDYRGHDGRASVRRPSPTASCTPAAGGT